MSYHRLQSKHLSGLGSFSDAEVMGKGCSSSSLPQGQERVLVEQILQTYISEAAQRANCSGPNAGMCRASVAGGFANQRAGIQEQLEAHCAQKANAAAAAAYEASMAAAAAAQTPPSSRTTHVTKFGPANAPSPAPSPVTAEPTAVVQSELPPARQPAPEPLVSTRTLIFVGIGVAALGAVYFITK